jgi:flagellin
MAIDPLSGAISAQAQTSIQKSNARLQAALAGLVSGVKVNRPSDDVALLSVASKLASETSGLRQVSVNLAQLSSLTQVADGGAEQVQNLLGKLQELAQQAASPTVNADQRQALNQQFKQISAEINRFTENTTFGNRKLLDGSLSGEKAISLDDAIAAEAGEGTGNRLSIASLSTTSLFEGRSLDILSPESARAALSAIGGALDTTRSVRAEIGAFQQAANFAAANIDSVIANQQAAASTLLDTDFAEASTNASLSNLQNNAALALLAQGNRLTPALLKLVG